LRSSSDSLAGSGRPPGARGFLAVKARDYTLAARVVGATDRRIILRHIMPNVSSTLIVVAYIDIANAILAESALSSSAWGCSRPTPSWGNMLPELAALSVP